METKKYTLAHRILHWIIAIAMPVLFLTGFLRMYWMNKNNILGIIQTNAPDLSKEQMTKIATTIREPMWQWHEIFAYVMVAAFVVRIAYMLAKGIRFPNPLGTGLSLKKRLQGFTYVYFYLFVLISAFTGICIQQGFLSQYNAPIEAVHKWGIYWFPIFVALHFMGILVAETGSEKGIASKMISGD